MSGGTNLLLATVRGCTKVMNSTRRGYVALALALALDADSFCLTSVSSGVVSTAVCFIRPRDDAVIVVVLREIDALEYPVEGYLLLVISNTPDTPEGSTLTFSLHQSRSPARRAQTAVRL
jgi:hypothetical protein